MQPHSTMNQVVRLLTVFEPASEFQQSDQILVSADTWTAFDRGHRGHGPILVALTAQSNGDVVGRLRPAVPADGLPADACRIPTWMWLHIGAPAGSDEDCWCTLTAIPPLSVPQAAAITLRARKEATLVDSMDPVAMLTASLSGAQGGLSWACLTVGAELPLSCGTFDVLEIRTAAGQSVPAASILDCDVEVELVPAMDSRAPEPPIPSTPPAPAEDDWSGPMIADLPSVSTPLFPGKGYSLR